MLIIIDVGNTSIKFGFAKGMKIIHSFTLPSEREMHSSDSLGLQLFMMLQNISCPINEVEAMCISSVVPAFDAFFEEIARKYLGNIPTYIVGKNIAVPLENKYDNPREVGADRLVAAYAARMLHPNEKSIISIDYGTATTFDCVHQDAYLGGLICPGVLSSHSILSSKAAKLPRIALEVDATTPELGKNTATSISHGFVFGFCAMTEGLLVKLAEKMPSKPFVVATGGFARDIAKHVQLINNIEPNLILLGLLLLYNNKKNGDLYE